MQPSDNVEFGLLIFGHAISLAAIAGTIGGIMPGLAATGAFVWYALCAYEKWLSIRSKRKRDSHE